MGKQASSTVKQRHVTIENKPTLCQPAIMCFESFGKLGAPRPRKIQLTCGSVD